MRVWFDLLTPKQLLFFRPVVERLRLHGHDVLTTSRRYREVEQMASRLGLELRYAGSRGGKDVLDQLVHSLARMEELIPAVAEFRPDAAVSVASADCARIAFGLRVRHVAVNDSPHSLVAGKLSLPLSYHLLSPWVIPYGAWSPFGLSRAQLTTYRALDPAAWLKRRGTRRSPRKGGSPTILVRLEESWAPYMAGSDETWSEKVMGQLARDFRGARLVALCRYDEQLSRVKARFGSTYEIPEGAVDGADFIEQSDAFVGMGGTMTTEAALLGVPAVSAFQGGALYTEKYLVSKELLMKSRSPSGVSRCVRSSLRAGYAEAYLARARRLLDWMEDPSERISRFLEGMPKAA